MVKIGIIGGSGLDDPKLLQDFQEKNVLTKYGEPSSKLTIGKINDIDVVLLARHGKGHTITPTHVNYRANIMALKNEGVTHILATTACGSLKQEIGRGDFIILSQFIDHTKHRKFSFHDDFKKGINHTAMPDPFDENLRQAFIQTSKELKLKYHAKGTVITIEGPRFSTRAESHMFRQFADVINMTVSTEVSLAQEAGIPYAAVAMSTDYDCWKEDEPPAKWEEILEVFKQNSDNVKKLIINTLPKVAGTQTTVKNTIETNKEGEKTMEEFDLKATLRTIPHFPKQGILFWDITSLLNNPEAFKQTMDKFYNRYKDSNIDVVAGIESRGFIFGSVLAFMLNKRFVPIRKKGKLPGKTAKMEYALEYGTDVIEIHTEDVKPGDNVLIIDDLIATAGTMEAACKLIESLNANIHECAAVIELPELKGKEKLSKHKVYTMIECEEHV